MPDDVGPGEPEQVSLLPFSATLLAHYVHLRLAVGVCWLNILLLGAGLEWSARYGRGAFVPGDARQARSRLNIFRRRSLLAQSLYGLAAAPAAGHNLAAEDRNTKLTRLRQPSWQPDALHTSRGLSWEGDVVASKTSVLTIHVVFTRP